MPEHFQASGMYVMVIYSLKLYNKVIKSVLHLHSMHDDKYKPDNTEGTKRKQNPFHSHHLYYILHTSKGTGFQQSGQELSILY